MLKCRQLVEETTRTRSLEELQGRQRWAIRFHLLICRHCRRYLRQLKTLLGVLSRLHRQADAQTVSRVMRRIQAAEKDQK